MYEERRGGGEDIAALSWDQKKGARDAAEEEEEKERFSHFSFLFFDAHIPSSCHSYSLLPIFSPLSRGGAEKAIDTGIAVEVPINPDYNIRLYSLSMPDSAAVTLNSFSCA